MNIPLRLAGTLLICFLAGSASAIEDFTAEYTIYKGVVKMGSLTRSLSLSKANDYVYDSRMSTSGIASLFARRSVHETSSGRFNGDRFVPHSYAYDKNNGEKKFQLRFDYDNNQVARADSEGKWQTQMPEIVFDKLVYQLQFMIDLARPQPPNPLHYEIADKNRLKHYQVDVLPPEVVQTPYGEFEAVRLERVKSGSKKRTTVWCAERLGWLPVKVEYRDKKGGIVNAVLKNVDGIALKPSMQQTSESIH